MKTRLDQEKGWWHSLVLEEIPLFNQRALGSQVQKLEQWVRWDGRLDRQSRQQAFEWIRCAAWSGEKATQWKALESLAKIAHGMGLKDFTRLQRAGRSTEELVELFMMKATALADLQLLAQQTSPSHPVFNLGRKPTKPFISLPRRLYARYLLWWLGQATAWWSQRLPFSMLKTVKLSLEALFLKKIIDSILEAIDCPDKPGYQFGNGYQDWASDYTADCFTTRLILFRDMDVNESVADLVAEIPRYHLTGLTRLDLGSKSLTSKEALQIIQAVVQQKAPLTILNLQFNRLTVINENMLDGLTQLNDLSLKDNQLSTLSTGVFNGLTQLNDLYLGGNQLSILSTDVFNGLTQLNDLELWGNQLSTLSTGVFNGLTQLNTLSLSGNQLSTLSTGVFNGLTRLNELDLVGNHLNDTTIKNLTQNFPYQLNYLYVDDNQIGNEGALTLAEMLPCTNLTSIGFSGNPANDTTIALAAQKKALQKVCDDQRCHANLPAAESCPVKTSSTDGLTEMDRGVWNRADFFEGLIATPMLSSPSVLTLPSSSDSSRVVPAAAAAGTLILGLTLSALLYKNSTWLRSIVNESCQLFQRCWEVSKPQKAKRPVFFIADPLYFGIRGPL